jgi:nitric oxide reductase large subunit
MFFFAVLFRNLGGAGLFGFLTNSLIALYYMQGLNTTANHGHAALFGVYGMLGLGLTLYCMRGLTDVTTWIQRSIMQALVWAQVPGDVVFSVGVPHSPGSRYGRSPQSRGRSKAERI